MIQATQEDVVRVLLDRYGGTFAQELSIPVEENSASSLFKVLVLSSLFNVRVDWRSTLKAWRYLNDRGWMNPRLMASAGFDDRRAALSEAGYAAFDVNEHAARWLGEQASAVVERYACDLNNLRERAGRDPEKERVLVAELQGMGKISADYFFREVQGVWDENYPFVDNLAMQTARRLDLPFCAGELAELVSREDFPRFAAALTRVHLTQEFDQVLKLAEQLERV